ncbi:hypothetical protein VMT65_11015 [Nocardia sp. CDC153]|uniref:hypothetical protein n=1 Tax=Nocardia sp. CDC153 TaxID=3112167 RepID=UPI002DB945D0|nr:hypothetical protein [Nocardia sp. CDC153]MEC3953563.1 hypothetical protein [Nocardia sp. CDC153]
MTTLLNRPGSRTEPDRGLSGRIRAVVPGRADTPTWIGYLAILAVVLAAITAVVMTGDARSARHGIDVIGHRTAPTVTSTEDLYFALADMDAQLANVLLAGNDSTLAAVRKNALATYEQRRVQADSDLQQAMTIATNGDAAQQIRVLLDKFGQYQALAADTFQLSDLDHGAAGQPSARTLAAYRSATGMVPDLLARAQKLADTNSGVLSQAYHDAEDSTVTGLTWIVVLGVLLLATLIGLQVLLRVALRRRVNPALAVTTVLAAGLLVGGYVAEGTAAHQLTVAKRDAFDSLLALRQARAVGYDANADESRYLLDPEHATDYQQSYFTKAQRLVGVQARGVDDYSAALDQALAAHGTDMTQAVSADSFLGAELRNITFGGEAAAARQSVLAYQVYQHDDHTLRRLAGTDPRAAIALDTGASNDHFAAYDKALEATIDINQHAFDAAIADGEDALAGWTDWLPYGAAVVFAVLILLGVRPRLAEYR